ncbi:MAG: hypothetical protein OHK0018_04680 [Erythrobacter tepidarius]
MIKADAVRVGDGIERIECSLSCQLGRATQQQQGARQCELLAGYNLKSVVAQFFDILLVEIERDEFAAPVAEAFAVGVDQVALVKLGALRLSLAARIFPMPVAAVVVIIIAITIAVVIAFFVAVIIAIIAIIIAIVIVIVVQIVPVGSIIAHVGIIATVEVIAAVEVIITAVAQIFAIGAIAWVITIAKVVVPGIADIVEIAAVVRIVEVGVVRVVSTIIVT